MTIYFGNGDTLAGTPSTQATMQTQVGNGNYTPTAGKTSFLVFCTGGGGGGGGVEYGQNDQGNNASGGSGAEGVVLL